eukprot:scaffold23368_cov71-Cyclotella_meneghiniana.AAC.14
MSTMNDGTRLRLEFIVCNGRNNLTFESLVGKILAYEIPTFHTKIVCVWMGTPIPISQQLDGLIVSNDETRLRL